MTVVNVKPTLHSLQLLVDGPTRLHHTICTCRWDSGLMHYDLARRAAREHLDECRGEMFHGVWIERTSSDGTRFDRLLSSSWFRTPVGPMAGTE